MKNIISLVSACWVVANLLIGFVLVLPIAIVNLIGLTPSLSRIRDALLSKIYRHCVRVDSFWMQEVVGINLVIKGRPNEDQSPVIICNHQSWFDIPLVQEVITRDGPMVRFLIKREIVWIPIIGWICLALNFPRLQRSKNTTSRQSDYFIIEQETKNHAKRAGALLIFPEGTRYTAGKKLAQNSPYDNLLKPRAGGLKIIQQHANTSTSLVDITIDYHQRPVNIWRCLHGNPKKITITLEHFDLSQITNVEDWLNERWKEKDKLFTS